jgi:mRNA-degrading endonuclease RelE of RelBE toxin-antitoxin system
MKCSASCRTSHEYLLSQELHSGSEKDQRRGHTRTCPAVIEEVEEAADLQGIGNLKKMTGTANFYRIRIGDHRIGVVVEEGTVEFVRCLSRRDLYRFFP